GWGRVRVAPPRPPRLFCHAEARSSHRDTESRLTRRRGGAEEVAGSGCVRRESERSSPGSTFMTNVVSSGGIRAHPAAEGAGRGQLHAAKAGSSGANHTITRFRKHAAKSRQRVRTRSTPPRPRP